MKILFYTNVPAPYRVHFFSLWGKSDDLTVLYDFYKASDRNKKWKAEDAPKSYIEIYLNKGEQSKRNELINGLRALHYIDKNKYDKIIIGTHGTLTAKILMLYMRVRRIPYTLNIDGMLTIDLKEKGKINKELRKILFRGAESYLVTNNETLRYLQLLGVSEKKVKIYHFSSIYKKDIVNPKREIYKKKIGCKTQHMILSVGRFINLKGFDVLLKSMANIQDNVTLYLIGGYPLQEYLDIVNKYRLRNVKFIPFLVTQELDDYYKAADLFVFPTRHDTWGLVLNEAIAKGLPIISTNRCGAALELIRNGVNGYLIEADNPRILSQCINLCMKNPEKLMNMSDYNYKLAYKYTIENMVLDHIKILRTK